MAPRPRPRSDNAAPTGRNQSDRPDSEGAKPADSSQNQKPQEIELNPEVFNGQTLIEVDDQEIELGNRYLAAFLAWLVPGAGHYYQGRHAKGTLFLICVLSIWFLGFSLGGGHVVYASWYPGDRRWHYALQAGVGVAALPAMVQGDRMRRATDPSTGRTLKSYRPLWGGLMAPPNRPVAESEADEVAAWYARRGSGYELGTWFTMIAGLLNLLVIYDAYGGPLAVHISGKRQSPQPSG